MSGALLSRGIGVEAGISTEEDVATLRASGLTARLLRVLIEPVDEAPDVAVQAAERVIQSLDAAQTEAPRLLHGSEAATWPMLRQALARGYDTRIGFEDTLLLPSGVVAQSNAELVGAAVVLARDSRR